MPPKAASTKLTIEYFESQNIHVTPDLRGWLARAAFIYRDRLTQKDKEQYEKWAVSIVEEAVNSGVIDHKNWKAQSAAMPAKDRRAAVANTLTTPRVPTSPLLQSLSNSKATASSLAPLSARGDNSASSAAKATTAHVIVASVDKKELARATLQQNSRLICPQDLRVHVEHVLIMLDAEVAKGMRDYESMTAETMVRAARILRDRGNASASTTKAVVQQAAVPIIVSPPALDVCEGVALSSSPYCSSFDPSTPVSGVSFSSTVSSSVFNPMDPMALIKLRQQQQIQQPQYAPPPPQQPQYTPPSVQQFKAKEGGVGKRPRAGIIAIDPTGRGNGHSTLDANNQWSMGGCQNSAYSCGGGQNSKVHKGCLRAATEVSPSSPMMTDYSAMGAEDFYSQLTVDASTSLKKLCSLAKKPRKQHGGTVAAIAHTNGGNDWSTQPSSSSAMLGYSTALERNYSRDEPDPADIRPFPVLQKALSHVLEQTKKRSSDLKHVAALLEEYSSTEEKLATASMASAERTASLHRTASQMAAKYLFEQIKGMRQDLVVQNIRNGFTVRVYELHARVCLEVGNLGEFNQCQSALRQYYQDGLEAEDGDHLVEFLCYRLLYQALQGQEDTLALELEKLELLSSRENNSKDDIPTLLTPNDQRFLIAFYSDAVQLIIRLCACLAQQDCERAFRIIGLMGRGVKTLIGIFLQRQRMAWLRDVVSSFRGGLPSLFLLSMLGLLPIRCSEDSSAGEKSLFSSCLMGGILGNTSGEIIAPDASHRGLLRAPISMVARRAERRRLAAVLAQGGGAGEGVRLDFLDGDALAAQSAFGRIFQDLKMEIPAGVTVVGDIPHYTHRRLQFLQSVKKMTKKERKELDAGELMEGGEGPMDNFDIGTSGSFDAGALSTAVKNYFSFLTRTDISCQ